MRCLALSLSAALFGTALPLTAHEFWIEPLDYQISRQATIEGDLVNGQEFEGPRVAYFPQRIAAFRYFADGISAPVDGTVGQTPALSAAPLTDGLHVVGYIAQPATLDYSEWEKFQRFIDHKDLGDVRPQHDARGLPEGGFTEVYIRYSKTLVAVGDGAGADLRTGMQTEIVALANPYTDDLTDGFPVQLFYQDDVRANEQIELFEKAEDGTVVITLHRTDDEGIAILPVRPGFSYMADAVVLREPSAELAEATEAVWETLWANLTWAVPAE